MTAVSFLRPQPPRGRRSSRQEPVDELAALLLRTGQGDDEAFATLYDAFAGAVHGVVLKVLRNPSLAEEVTQEVLVDVWRQAPRYDPHRGSARGWVLTMAHRRAVDKVRSAQASSEREQRVAARDAGTAFDEVAETVELTLEAERVRGALGTLTPLQREALELAYFGGHTHREVAEILDVPLGTVKTRLRDGLTRLRDEMGVEVA